MGHYIIAATSLSAAHRPKAPCYEFKSMATAASVLCQRRVIAFWRFRAYILIESLAAIAIYFALSIRRFDDYARTMASAPASSITGRARSVPCPLHTFYARALPMKRGAVGRKASFRRAYAPFLRGESQRRTNTFFIAIDDAMPFDATLLISLHASTAAIDAEDFSNWRF